MHLQQKQRSFLTFGFSAGGSPTSTSSSSSNADASNSSNSSQQHLSQSQSPVPKRESSQLGFNPANSSVNLSAAPSMIGGPATNNANSSNSVGQLSQPTSNNQNGAAAANSDAPEIRKYKKRFNSEILCAALWGVNLLIGTENGLMLLDRSGQGKVYQLISRRRFQQMEVLEGQNILVTISGKKSRIRVYYLSWLFSKIIRTEEVRISMLKLTLEILNCAYNFHLKKLFSNQFFFTCNLFSKSKSAMAGWTLVICRMPYTSK